MPRYSQTLKNSSTNTVRINVILPARGANDFSVQLQDLGQRSRLQMLVPSVGKFFTSLPLKKAFLLNEPRNHMSSRRFVSPSFNDVRRLLASAQLLEIAERGLLSLVTFDGDYTLYDDGQNIASEDLIACLEETLRRDVYVGIVTAAGYPDKAGEMYAVRLLSLLQHLYTSNRLTDVQKSHLYVMGGECNYFFRFQPETGSLCWIDPGEWMLSDMLIWDESDIDAILDSGEAVLHSCIEEMKLPAQVIRKSRAVGMIPHIIASTKSYEHLSREHLEEVVMAAQQTLSQLEVATRIPFTCFNGGADVWIDIGDKRLGVTCMQRYFSTMSEKPFHGENCIHWGDQFLSLGSNDFKARQACTTVWITNPKETTELLSQLLSLMLSNPST